MQFDLQSYGLQEGAHELCVTVIMGMLYLIVRFL